MRTIFTHSLRRSLGGIIGWGLTLGLLGLYVISLFDIMQEQQEAYLPLFQAYPPELMAAFGDINALFDPGGYLQFTFFSYMPLVLGFYAILGGSAMLAADEEKGTLDLVLAQPLRRRTVFFSRLGALLLAILAILFLGWLGCLPLLDSSKLGLSPGELLLPFLSLFGLLVFFAGLGLLLSMLLPSHRLAGTLSGLALVTSFFVTTFERLNPDLQAVADFSPLNYYQGGLAVSGLEWGWLGGLLGLGVLFILLAWWRFERRDIRVGGEGGWQLPFLRAKGEKE